MAVLRQVRSNDPRALLQAAADGFLASRAPDRSDPFRSPEHLLVLRQGGQRDDLIAIAAERGIAGWFDPPLCLFQQLPEWLGSSGLKPCGDYERVVLISRLLRETTAVFGRLARPDAFVDAVDRLFGELVSEGIEPDSFTAALARNAYRDEFENGRDADLAACYRAYLETLDTAGRRDGRDWLIDSARTLAADPAALTARLGGRREIRIVGLQDVRGGWRQLLPALLNSPVIDAVVLYSTIALEPLEGVETRGAEWIGPRDSLAERLFIEGDASAATDRDLSATSAAPPPVLHMLSAPDAEREVEEVARRVRQLLDDGTAPPRIAIVARSARPWVDRVVDALALYGVPATARRRFAFPEIPVVRAVLALFAVAAEGWTRHGLVELAEQPYFGRMTGEEAAARNLDSAIINQIGYRRRVTGLDAWIDAHLALSDAARERQAMIDNGQEPEYRGRDTPPPVQRASEALASFRGFAERARELERSRPLKEWVDWLRDFIENDPWKIERQVYRVPEGRFDVARVDAAGWRGMRSIIAQWYEALDTWSGGDDVIDVVAFESVLREMLSGDAAMWTPTHRAVFVSEGLAAAQRSFDHVFIVGLSGDTFPLRAPRSPILDEYERRRLVGEGVPLETREVWETRERELFRALVAGARESLTLSWPRTDGEGRELAPSAYVEELEIAVAAEPAWASLLESTVLESSVVASPSLPLVPSVEVREYAAHNARVERARQTGELSPWNGHIRDPALTGWLASDRLGEELHVWSATQLEAYAKCPWSWFSQRLLRLDELDDPDIDIDPLVRGTILHLAMQRFYDAAKERVAGPVFLQSQDLSWALPLVRDALTQAIDETGSTAWLGAPALHATKRAELERLVVGYIEWEIEYNEAMLRGSWQKKRILRAGVDQHELKFGSMPGSDEGDDVILELDGVRFRLRGSMDRVEVGVDDRIEDAATYLAAVDYKSGRYSTPGGGSGKAWDDGVVLQVPLYAHVLEKNRPGSRVARVEYRAIKHCQTVHSLELYQVRTDGLFENTEAREKMDRALEAAGGHVARARAGQFPAQPAPSCNCPPYCHAWDICRVKGGPNDGRG